MTLTEVLLWLLLPAGMGLHVAWVRVRPMLLSGPEIVSFTPDEDNRHVSIVLQESSQAYRYRGRGGKWIDEHIGTSIFTPRHHARLCERAYRRWDLKRAKAECEI